MLQFIKMGTNCVVDEYGNINHSLMQKKCEEIENLDYDNVLVLSGSIKLGMMEEGEKRSKKEMTNTELQGYASVGQNIMMSLCMRYFTGNVAQIQVTETDLKHENHINELIKENLRRGRMNVINYNDSVDFEEIRKDNDTLASQLTSYCGADRLLILGHYGGLVDNNHDLVERVRSVDESVYSMCNGASSDGNGGMYTKIQAGKELLGQGIEMIIGNVNYDLNDVIEGNVQRTLFRS